MTASDDPLREAFGEAEPEHYAWQTQNPAVADAERRLVQKAFLPLGKRVLDLGCGDGATLHHLGEPEGAYGVDLFQGKVDFASSALPRCRFVRASVYELPFERGSFDHILVRDLVHHLDEPERFVEECARVLGPGGRVDVLEPCRYNPLILLHALTNRVERGELRSTRGFLVRLLERRFRVEAVRRYQALPLHRLLFHPKFGAPGLADNVPLRSILATLEQAAEWVLPEPLWAYLHVRARSEP